MLTPTCPGGAAYVSSPPSYVTLHVFPATDICASPFIIPSYPSVLVLFPALRHDLERPLPTPVAAVAVAVAAAVL